MKSLNAILFTDLGYYITSHLSMLQGNINFCSLLAVPPSFCGVGSFLRTSSLGMTPSSFSLKVKMGFPSKDVFLLRLRHFALMSAPSTFSTNPMQLQDLVFHWHNLTQALWHKSPQTHHFGKKASSSSFELTLCQLYRLIVQLTKALKHV